MTTRHGSLLHLAQQIFDVPLAIIPSKLESILRAVGPRLSVDQSGIDNLLSEGVLSRYDADVIELGDSAKSSKSDKPYFTTDSGIAILPIRGTLMKSGGWMEAASGCSTYSSIRASLESALEDRKVRAILFDVDSPGGTTHGCFELADYIRSCRGSKPMCACANDLAASAAYALASAADSIWVTSTGAVGSIGVFALHTSQVSADAKAGIKYEYIHYGAHKVDGNPHSDLSDAARADMQSEVDREGDIFVECVSANRGVSFDRVKATQARVKFGENSIPLLADSVGTKSDCLAYLESIVDSPTSRGGTISHGASLTNSRFRTDTECSMPAIPPHKTSTSAKSWDGPANKKRLREGEVAGYYRKAYAFQKAGASGHNKSDFSYIHHEVGGDGHVGSANLKACQSSIGVLNGGRAGTILKGGDRKGVYNHVAAHLRDAGKDPSPLATYRDYLMGASAYATEPSNVQLSQSVSPLLATTDWSVVDVDGDVDDGTAKHSASESESESESTVEMTEGAEPMANTTAAKMKPKSDDYMKKGAKKPATKPPVEDEEDDMKSAVDEDAASECDDKEAATDPDESEDYPPANQPKKKDKTKDKTKGKKASASFSVAELTSMLATAKKDKKDKTDDDDEDEEDDPDEKEPDDDEDDEEAPEPAKQKKSASADPAREIVALCTIAGMEYLIPKYVSKGYSVSQVRQFLQARRVKANQANQVNSSFSFTGSSSPAGTSSIDRAIASAKTMALNSGGKVTESAALAHILAENPSVYEDYDEERRRVALQGTNKDIVAYGLQSQRTMRALKLGTDFGSPPSGARA